MIYGVNFCLLKTSGFIMAYRTLKINPNGEFFETIYTKGSSGDAHLEKYKVISKKYYIILLESFKHAVSEKCTHWVKKNFVVHQDNVREVAMAKFDEIG